MRAATAMPRSPTAYLRALRRLARRDHSEDELRRALGRAGHDGDEVEEALARIRDHGYLDDRRYATSFSRDRLANRGIGRHRIRVMLRQRGVAPEDVDAGLEEALAEVSEIDILETLARRYVRSRRHEPPDRLFRKLAAFLFRRGFPMDLIRDRLRHGWPTEADAALGAPGDIAPEPDDRVPAPQPGETIDE